MGPWKTRQTAHPCVGRAWLRPLVALVASPNVHGVPGGPMDHRWAGSWPRASRHCGQEAGPGLRDLLLFQEMVCPSDRRCGLWSSAARVEMSLCQYLAV